MFVSEKVMNFQVEALTERRRTEHPKNTTTKSLHWRRFYFCTFN